MMATATVQDVSTEALKEAIMLLIEEHKTEFKQLLNGFSSKKKAITKKKQDTPTPIAVVQKVRVPYYEMPFWKANPHLKPLDAPPYAIKKEDFEALKALFQQPDCPPIEAWIAELD